MRQRTSRVFVSSLLTLVSTFCVVCWNLKAQELQLLPSSTGEIVEHKFYTLSYSETHEQAEWVYYILNPEMVSGGAKRKNNFRADPNISTGSASLADYKGSGYDRGHLCPAASMSIDDDAMSESFYLSNMSPQLPSFNRGGWKQLETAVRSWAVSEGELHVVTGVVLSDSLGCIGVNEVTIPRAYYKAIYAPKREEMVGFLMPNEKIENPLSDYIVNIDSLESITGVDLYIGLDDKLEDRLEGNVKIDTWHF